MAALGTCIVLTLVAACGYRMAGSGELPGGVKTLAVHVFNNRTAETGLEATVTNALIAELNRRRKNAVVETDKAQAVLTGTVQSLGKETIARSSSQTASERRVTVTVSLALTRADGRVIWERSGIRAEQAYAVDDSDKTATETRLRSALDDLSQRLAEEVVRQLTMDF